MDEKQISIMRPTYELLARLLRLPEGHRIIAAYTTDRDKNSQAITLQVEGPKMFRVLEGQEIPWMNPKHFIEQQEEELSEDGREQQSGNQPVGLAASGVQGFS